MRATGALLLVLLAVMGSGMLGLVVSGYVIRQMLSISGSSFLRLLAFFVLFYIVWMVSILVIALGGAALADAAIPAERRSIPSYPRWVLGIARCEGPWYSGATLAVAVLAAAGIVSRSSSVSVLALAGIVVVAVVLDRRARMKRSPKRTGGEAVRGDEGADEA
jgi:hypothetical protein